MTEKTPSLWLPWPTVVALIVAGIVTIYGIAVRSEPIQNAGVWIACLVTMATLFLFSRLAREQAARLQIATEYNHTLARLHTIALAERDRALEQLRAHVGPELYGERHRAGDVLAVALSAEVAGLAVEDVGRALASALLDPVVREALTLWLEAGHHTTQEPEA